MEKTIVTGNFTKKNIVTIIFLILAILSFIGSVIIFNTSASPYDTYFYTSVTIDTPEGIGVLFYMAIAFVVAALFFWFEMSFCELTVTNKRVYGKAAFGKSIDLPYDEISSVGTCLPNGIFAATSSGAVKFWLLTNQKEVYQSLSDLLKERQGQTVNASSSHTGNADELKKYKELLDSGVITQDEFEAKKKQLLGL